MYDSNKYWIERGKTEFIREHNRPLHEKIFYSKYFLDKIDNQLFDVFDLMRFDTVLEVGCGWGFMSKKLLTRYSNITKYLGIDISKEQLEKSNDYIDDIRFSNTFTDILDIKPFHNVFDLVLESTVFIHLKPEEIKKAINNSFSLCKKYTVSWDWFDPDNLGASYGDPAYCFNHDYRKLYLDAGANRVSVYPIKHSLSFLKNYHIPKISRYFSYPSCLVVAFK